MYKNITLLQGQFVTNPIFVYFPNSQTQT